MKNSCKKILLVVMGLLLVSLPLPAAEKTELRKQGFGLQKALKEAKQLKDKVSALGLESGNELMILKRHLDKNSVLHSRYQQIGSHTAAGGPRIIDRHQFCCATPTMDVRGRDGASLSSSS